MFQHYVPIVYLKQFVDPGVVAGHEPFLWVVDTHSGTTSKRAPKNVAGENEFNESIGVTTGPGAGVESRLSVIESCAKKEIDRLKRQGKGFASFDDRLMRFIATLSTRTPWARTAVQNHFSGNQRYVGTLAELSPHERWAASIEYLATWTMEYFGRMKWSLAGPERDTDFFITSDRPVVLTGEHADGSLLDFPRLAEHTSIVTVPITSRLALVGAYDSTRLTEVQVSVNWFNTRIVQHATRFLYMPKKMVVE